LRQLKGSAINCRVGWLELRRGAQLNKLRRLQPSVLFIFLSLNSSRTIPSKLVRRDGLSICTEWNLHSPWTQGHFRKEKRPALFRTPVCWKDFNAVRASVSSIVFFGKSNVGYCMPQLRRIFPSAASRSNHLRAVAAPASLGWFFR
jgi:hypothetical protein